MQVLPTRPSKSWLVTEHDGGRPAKVYESVRHDAFVSSVIAAIHGERFADAVQLGAEADAAVAAATADADALKLAA